MMSTFLVDETATDMPVRDITLSLSHFGVQEFSVAQNARERQAISRVSRQELEDKWLRLNEESQLLKQHIHEQKDKIKRLGTKLVRMQKDRQVVAGANNNGGRLRGGRDVEMEEMMEELQEKVRELETQNEGLKRRLLVSKHQLLVQGKRPPPHPYLRVQSRIDTGRKRVDTPTPSHLHPRSTRTVAVEVCDRPPAGLLPRYGHSLLEDTRAEIRNLENVIESQRRHMEEMDGANEILRDQLRKREGEYERSLLQLREEQTGGQRSTIKDNVEMIRQQKQLSEKADALTVLEGRFLHLQESQRTLKASHDAVMSKMDELTRQLKDERLRSLGLDRQLQNMTLAQRRTEELQEQISDLEKERDLLKENCDKLLNSALDVSQEQKWRLREQKLKVQIAQLEMALKSDLTDKNEILDIIKAERDVHEKLMEENKQLQIRFLEQKQKLEEVNDRMKFYTKESEVDVSELSEALMLIKVRRSQRSGELGFLEQLEEEARGDKERAVREIQAAYAETVLELEKTRNMLIIQHKINKDYQAEVEAVTRKMDDSKMEYELKLERLAQLLDTRAARIRKLEAQLRDIAYGTKAYTFRPDITDEDMADEFDETVHLERGENLLEVHLGSAALSPSALEALGDREPSTFCTYAVYDFELQSTPVVKGARPSYGFTSQYVVRVDDVFLQYLHTGSVTVELQLARGMDFQTAAAGQLRLQQLLEQDGKVHGTVQLVGVSGEVQSFGSVEYWVRLRVPMEQAIRLYKERVKAMGYISTTLSDERQTSAAGLTPQPASTDSSYNELSITIQGCSALPSRGSGQEPSPYVVYKFFDFPDHDTHIVQESRWPRFDDHVSYPVPMDADLDRYLKLQALQLYVFNDQEEQGDTYLGKARVPLLSLAHDKGVTGVFELTDPAGLPVGHVDLTLKWRFTYLPPPGSTMTVEQAKFIPKEKPVKLTPHDERKGDVVEEGKKEEEGKKKKKKEKEEGKKKKKEEEEKKEEVNDVLKEEEKEEEPKAYPRLASLPAVSKAPLAKPRRKAQRKSKVTFLDEAAAEDQDPDPAPWAGIRGPSPPTESAVPTLEEEDEEESHFSEGQVIPVSSQSYSDDSEIEEEIIEEDILEAPEEDQSASIHSDSDDCIVPGQSSTGRKPQDRMRVEVVSLSLRPESRAARDHSVVRLFVEYSLLDLPSEETVSLPKPLPGKSSHYNHSNVIHVDVEDNKDRRELLKGVLEGDNSEMESIRFTVVSEPPQEEDQERECENVGVAYLRIPDILENQRDLIDTSLNVVDVEDSTVVVGSLTVSVEGLEALRSIMEDPEHDLTPISSLQPMT